MFRLVSEADTMRGRRGKSLSVSRRLGGKGVSLEIIQVRNYATVRPGVFRNFRSSSRYRLSLRFSNEGDVIGRVAR